MEAKTWGAMRLELRNELNLGDQGLVENDELMVMANRGLQFAEAEIHSTNEQYFRTNDVLTLVAGTSEYALPTDVFGCKLLLVEFDDGDAIYEIPRIRQRDIGLVEDGQELRYDLDNSTANGMRMKFYPTPTADEAGANVKRRYLRRVKLITSDATVVDLPEFSLFVFAYVKVQVLLKSEVIGTPALLTAAQTELQMARDLMVKSLSSAVPDETEGQVDGDMSFYNESLA